MANTTHSGSNALRVLIEQDKLNGVNFIDWDRNLRLVLKYERKEYVLIQDPPAEPPLNAARALRDSYQKFLSDQIDVSCIMMGSMVPELQKQFMDISGDPRALMAEVKEMFKEKARVERYDTFRELVSCKLKAGAPVSPHVLKMKRLLEHMIRLGLDVQKEMAADFVLQSLPDAYSDFVVNYNMHDMDKSVAELHGMLVTAEKNL